jgi:DeoR/GlpR family transcriptional regulator of sugar metabolism
MSKKITMFAQQRRAKILELLQEEGSARVSNLSRIFEVSEPTIRQDLERLEADGYIVREHGGAYLKTVPEQVRSLALQHTENMDKKRLIGKKARELIQDGDFIILDSGSTVTEIAKNLDGFSNLKIITNSLNIALLLGGHYSFEVMVTGGDFKPPTLSLTGEKAASFFDKIFVNKLFLATGGISFAAGLTYPGFQDIVVKRAMIRSATEVYVVADSTKIGKTSFAALGGLDLIRYFITDGSIRDEDRKEFERRGIAVIVAQ